MQHLISAIHRRPDGTPRLARLLSVGLVAALTAGPAARAADAAPARAADTAAESTHQPVRPAWLATLDHAQPAAASPAALPDDHKPVRPAWLAAFAPQAETGAAASAQADADAQPHSLAARVGAAWGRRLHTFGSKVRQVASWTQHGVATWYGNWHNGRRTSSGEIFNPRLMTAAHPSLPLGTRLLVTNTETGDSVVVTVNDREPRHPNSIIDLSRGAAAKLGFVASGRAAVKLTRLEPGQDPVEVADAPDDVTGTQPAPQGAAMGLP